MFKALIEIIVKSFFGIFGYSKKAPTKRVMVICENGYSFEEEVNFTESGKAYVTQGSLSVFLDNPDQKEGEIKPYTTSNFNGYAYRRWYYI